MLDRTSTFRVLEFTLNHSIQSMGDLIRLSHESGHKRKDADITRMARQIEELGMISGWKPNQMVRDVDIFC